MKLVDILARELKVWPAGVESLSQLRGTGYIINGKGFDGRAFDSMQLADETRIAGAIVTHAQWQAAVDALKDPATPAWNGEGLPPVGVDALLKSEHKLTEGTRLESFPAGTTVYVGGHANFGGCDLAVIIIKGRHFCGTIIPELLEPVRTAEQIAAEEKQNAWLAGIAAEYDQETADKCAAVLVAGGYRRRVAP